MDQSHVEHNSRSGLVKESGQALTKGLAEGKKTLTFYLAHFMVKRHFPTDDLINLKNQLDVDKKTQTRLVWEAMTLETCFPREKQMRSLRETAAQRS